MTQTRDWYDIIATELYLAPDAARRLREIGFVVIPGPVIQGGCEWLSNALEVVSRSRPICR